MASLLVGVNRSIQSPYRSRGSFHQYRHHFHPYPQSIHLLQHYSMAHSNCPGCLYDKQRKAVRAELRRRRQHFASHPVHQNQPQTAASPSSIPDLEESEVEDSEEEESEGDWETDEEQEDEYRDMVDAMVSHALAYGKAMKGTMATDKERKHAEKVLAALRVVEAAAEDLPLPVSNGNRKGKQVKGKGKGKQSDLGTSSTSTSSRTQEWEARTIIKLNALGLWLWRRSRNPNENEDDASDDEIFLR
ncbi:hypothetical protein NP233_g11109 [Leucocoprinus birnbaumii]|uniref:Uncharacterized protein n=1 Tax=Leucocoprinus birnbaumii TaxID=56174 RepID=A0AAD5YR96_9AGAR|nr:hypothetical protein NP233_g11109 [Leucocoprinus birnbaumii]